jgi:hypothetical protein
VQNDREPPLRYISKEEGVRHISMRRSGLFSMERTRSPSICSDNRQRKFCSIV